MAAEKVPRGDGGEFLPLSRRLSKLLYIIATSLPMPSNATLLVTYTV